MKEFKFDNCRVEVYGAADCNVCYVYANGSPWRVYSMRTTLDGLRAAEVAKHFASRAGRI